MVPPSAALLVLPVRAEATIEQRPHANTARGAHPAANRDIELYRGLQASAEPIPDRRSFAWTPRAPLAECADRALSYLRYLLPTDPDPINAASRPPRNEATT